MRLKIKWNDDRVRGATEAILLIGRDRLARGLTTDLVRASLADYRADPDGYKARRRAWTVGGAAAPLTNPAQAVLLRELAAAVDALQQKMTQGRRQFNSLLELDNYLIAGLERTAPRGGDDPRPPGGRRL